MELHESGWTLPSRQYVIHKSPRTASPRPTSRKNGKNAVSASRMGRGAGIVLSLVQVTVMCRSADGGYGPEVASRLMVPVLRNTILNKDFLGSAVGTVPGWPVVRCLGSTGGGQLSDPCKEATIHNATRAWSGSEEALHLLRCCRALACACVGNHLQYFKTVWFGQPLQNVLRKSCLF